VETVTIGISNGIIYIKDLLIHAASHVKHFASLDQVLQCLLQHNIKKNLQKSVFGSKEIAYLGFRLTEECGKLGTTNLTAVKNTPLPSSVHEVQQFLDFYNFF
jgi:hypothetical protein